MQNHESDGKHGVMNFAFHCQEPATDCHRKVAIVGAGPAGLAAAGYLACKGCSVTVLDKLPAPGGLMTFAIPDYRLPGSRVAKGIERLRHMGVTFLPNTKISAQASRRTEEGDQFIEQELHLNELVRDFDSVLVCTGAWKPRPLNIPGEELPGVFTALAFLLPLRAALHSHPDVQPVEVEGKRIVVIGAGHSAMDACHTALHRNPRELHLTYRRSRNDAPCGQLALEEVEQDGGLFHEYLTPVRILGQDRVTGVEFLNRDRETVVLKADVVVTAIGDIPTAPAQVEVDLASITKGAPLISTSIDKVYVAGDLATGPSKIGRAFFSGLKAARALCQCVNILEQADVPEPEDAPIDDDPVLYVDYDACIGCELCEAVCRFEYGIPRVLMTRTTLGVIAPLYCHHCQNPACARKCPHHAITRLKSGKVVLDSGKCAGCDDRLCLQGCPFGAVVTIGAGYPSLKCDFCADRRLRGLGPACAETCPTGAIRIVNRSEAKQLKKTGSTSAYKRMLTHLKGA